MIVLLTLIGIVCIAVVTAAIIDARSMPSARRVQAELDAKVIQLRAELAEVHEVFTYYSRLAAERPRRAREEQP